MPFSDAEITRLYERYAASLHRRARYVLDDPSRRDLVVEQTFVAALQQEQDVRASDSPLTALYRIQTEVIRDFPMLRRLAESTQRPTPDVERIWAALDVIRRKQAIARWIDRCSAEELGALGLAEASDTPSGIDPFQSHEGVSPGKLGPSMLLVDRFACGELRGEARTGVQTWLTRDGVAAAQLEALKDARKHLPPLRLAALRSAAGIAAPPNATSITSPAPPAPPDAPIDTPLESEIATPMPAEHRPVPPPPEPAEADELDLDLDLDLDPEPEAFPERRELAAPDIVETAIRIPPSPRGPARKPAAPPANRRLPIGWALLVGVVLGAMLYFAQARNQAVRPRPDAVLSLQPTADGTPGRLRFELRAPTRQRYALFSVDLHGHVTPITPEAVASSDRLASDGTAAGAIVLPEGAGSGWIVVVVDSDVTAATDRVVAAFKAGGADGVLGWSQAASDVDAVPWPTR